MSKIEKLEFVLGLYYQEDVMTGNDAYGIAIQALENGEPYAVLTVNVPGPLGCCECIAVQNAAYMDTNNCPWVSELVDAGIAKNTGLTRSSGFCEYPLYIFDEEWLRSIDTQHKYDEYLKSWRRVFDYEYEDEDEE